MPCAQPLLSGNEVAVAKLLLGSASAVGGRLVELTTVVTAVAELLPGFGSAVAVPAFAVALKLALCATLTEATIVALRTLAGVVGPDQLQTTGLSVLQTPPALGLTETRLVPGGKARLKLTFCASFGPALLTFAR